jgi:D-alanine-D-alanine ligase
MKNYQMVWRKAVLKTDEKNVRDIVESTGFFNPEEIEIAVELVTEHLQTGIASGYHFIFAETECKTIGYACFGPIPATQSSYDLYWIAVHNDYRGAGIGKQLLNLSEQAIAELGGKQIYIETSGREQYRPTRAFYLACNYIEDAVLNDFYAPGDAKYIYVKSL